MFEYKRGPGASLRDPGQDTQGLSEWPCEWLGSPCSSLQLGARASKR